MPYGLVAALAAIGLGARFLTLGEPSRGSKVAVAAVVAFSLVIWWSYPQWTVVAILLQVAVGIGILLYLRMHPSASE